MLKTLSIKNYALIEHLHIDFQSGFSTLTGETGAGKSIMLGALSLILGNRADSAALKDKEQKCVIEAEFDIKEYQLEALFKDNDLDYDGTTIIRREIAISGKSRAFVNDTPTNLNVLKILGTQLVDIHSQHENLELNNNLFQLKVLDAYAKNHSLLTNYQSNYKQFKILGSRLNELQELSANASADLDYNNFQFNQLYELKLESIALKELEGEMKQLENAEDIQEALNQTHHLINDQEISINTQLSQIKQYLLSIQEVYSPSKDFIERIESARIDLLDISSECENDSESIVYHPEKAAHLKEQLDSIYSLMQKHKAENIKDLIAVKNDFEQKLLNEQSFGEEIESTKAALKVCEESLQNFGGQLTTRRSKGVKPLCKYIQNQLADLGMKNATLEVEIHSNGAFYNDGLDKINFLFSANKGNASQNISKIASGGEISRLMLSIKSLLSQSTALPTIIFDEIDTGVSGEIADKMADIMQIMANTMQVISITHLPQIAARGNAHYKVYKKENKDSVHTHIEKLSEEQRIEELARMLSGKDITNQAIENAKTLMRN